MAEKACHVFGSTTQVGLTQALGRNRDFAMTASTVVILLNLGAALAALVAAFLWHKSATVQVPHKDEPDASGLYPAAIIVGDNTDFIGTVVAQSTWSKRGAYAAAIAAALQGLALLLQSVAA